MESIIILITVCLMISMGLSELFHRMHYPRVIGQIFAGIILAIPFINKLIIVGNNANIIAALAEFGIVFLLFLTGLQVNLKDLKKYSKNEFIIATFGAIIPFLLGFSVMKALGYSTNTCLVLGACLSITAPGTTLKLLMELKKIKSKVSEIIIGAAIIDDIFAIIFLTLISIIASTDTPKKLMMLPIEIILFVVSIFIIFKIIPPLMKSIVAERSEVAEFTTAIIIALLITVFATIVGLGPILGAFMAGIVMQISFKDKKEENKIVEHLTLLTFGLIIPFFFIHLGLNLNLTAIIKYPVIVALIMIIAIGGKMLGSVLVVFFSKLKLAQAKIIGWEMNSRGAIELAIAEMVL